MAPGDRVAARSRCAPEPPPPVPGRRPTGPRAPRSALDAVRPGAGCGVGWGGGMLGVGVGAARFCLIYGSAENRSAPAASAPAAAAAAAATSQVSGSRWVWAPAARPEGARRRGPAGLGTGSLSPWESWERRLSPPHLQKLGCARVHSGSPGLASSGGGQGGAGRARNPDAGSLPACPALADEPGASLPTRCSGVSAGPIKACVLGIV